MRSTVGCMLSSTCSSGCHVSRDSGEGACRTQACTSLASGDPRGGAAGSPSRDEANAQTGVARKDVPLQRQHAKATFRWAAEKHVGGQAGKHSRLALPLVTPSPGKWLSRSRGTRSRGTKQPLLRRLLLLLLLLLLPGEGKEGKEGN